MNNIPANNDPASNDLTDIAGILVGNAEDHACRTGVTVIMCEEPFVAACDVRGGRDPAPAKPICFPRR